MVDFRDFELFSIYWVLIFEMDFMSIVLGQPQVIFVQADGLLMLEQDVNVFFSEFVWNLQVAMSCDLVSGQLGLGSVWNVALDGRTDLCHCVIREWVDLIIFNLHDTYTHNTHNVISFDSNFARSAFFDDDLAILVFVDADQ